MKKNWKRKKCSCWREFPGKGRVIKLINASIWVRQFSWDFFFFAGSYSSSLRLISLSGLLSFFYLWSRLLLKCLIFYCFHLQISMFNSCDLYTIKMDYNMFECSFSLYQFSFQNVWHFCVSRSLLSSLPLNYVGCYFYPLQISAILKNM